MEKLSIKAKYYAIDCHSSTNHKYDGQPYEVHLQWVVNVAKKYLHLIPDNYKEEILAACWAHDVIEDCRETYNDVKKALGSEVVELVFACTNEKGRTRKDRANDKFYKELNEVPLAPFVKICDRIANFQYSVQNRSKMAVMYAKENEYFSERLYCHQYADMFEELKKLAETALSLFKTTYQ